MKFIPFLLLPFLLIGCGTSSSSEESIDQFHYSFMGIVEENSPAITETSEFSECLEPSVRMCVNQAANTLAQKKKSLSICEKLKNSEDANSCKFGVVIATLNQSNIPKLCDTLTGKYQEECLLTSIVLHAESSGDIEICKEMKESPFSGGETNLTNRIDQCIFSVIMKKEDAKLSDCDFLGESSQKNICNSMIQSRSTQKTSNNK